MPIDQCLAGPCCRRAALCRHAVDFERVAERPFFDPDALAAGAAQLERDDVGRSHKAGDERRVGVIVDLLRGPDLDGAPGIEDGDAIGHHHRLLSVVRDVDGGDAKVLLERLDLVPHLLADPRVKIGERFVEQQDLWVDRQRPAERDALALAAGEGRHVALAEPVKPQHRQQRSDPPADVGAADAAQFQAVTDVLSDGHVRPQGIGLEYHRNVTFVGRQPGDVAPTDRDRAADQRSEPADRAQ
jgi:hypothetical protein